MDLEVNKINRQVYFLHLPAYDSELDPPGKNNRWIYDRAPDGYKFVLVSVEVSARISASGTSSIFGMFDGHEFTNWLLFPGVESRQYLTRSELKIYNNNFAADLHNWECKEFTLAGRSLATAEAVKYCVIVWFYLRKMTPDETKMYAVIQPRGEHYRKGGPRTLTEGEETV